jgi:hypothetical protein
MAWTAPKTWTVGEIATAANLNTHIRDNELWLGTRKGFRLRRVAAQSIPNTGTATAISWDTEDSDTDAFGSVPGTTYTVPTGLDGVYGVTMLGISSSSSLGTIAGIRITTAGGLNFDSGFTPGTGVATVTIILPLSSGSTIVCSAFQNGAAAINFSGSLYVHWLGR